MTDYTRLVQAFNQLKSKPNHKVGSGLIEYVEDLATNSWPGYDQQEIDTILTFLSRFSNVISK